MVKRLLAVVLVVGSYAPSAAVQARRMDLEAFGRIVRLSDPQIAPDGRSIVLVASRANFEENRFDADLVQVDVATGAQRALTNGRRSLGQPRWSPSGAALAFLAQGPPAPGRQAKTQVFVLPMNGGEPKQVTDAVQGVQHFAWSPDGARIAYVTADEAPKRDGVERHNRSFEIGNDDFLVQEERRPTHAWLVDADGRNARRLTSGAWSLPTSFPPGPPASPLSWSPDGKFIALTRVISPHPGDFDYAQVHVLDVANGSLRPLTGRTRFEAHPVFSPDGSRIAFWRPRSLETNDINEIYVAPAEGGDGAAATASLDRNMARALWMPHGKSLLTGANDSTRVSLWVQPIGGGAATRLALGDVSPSSSFWVDVNVGRDGAIAFVGSTPTQPAELYYLSSPSAPPRRVTDLNADAAALDLGRTEVIEWQSDGFTHNGVVTYPPDFAASRTYPLVLVIHGGPRAASLQTFAAQAQLFAARGWVVFQPNYRGSDQLGRAYQNAITNDAGAGPGRDVMAGLAVLKKRGFVDESRIAVSGWSYGGYMTTWLIGNYSGWRAAVAGAAVTDNLDQYNLGDGNVRRRYAFGGSPWTSPERMKAYIAQSPITYAPKIRTPTLIMSNMGDYRVPVTQSFQLYRALKDNGVDTQFIGYPLPGHNAADPVHQRDVQRRWMQWIADRFDAVAATTSGR